MRVLRLLLWALVPIAAFAAGAYYYSASQRPAPQQAGIAADAPLGGPFRLVDQNGEPVTEAIFRDKPSAVFFGFTHCPDICPTALSEMAVWIESLGADADRMRFVFVTVDPERDTPEALKDYLGAFSERLVGLTGEPEAVDAMLRDHHVYYKKVPLEGGDYSMDHSASIFLLNDKGGLAGTISPSEPHEAGLAKLQRLVAG